MENQAVEKAKELLRHYPGLSFPVDMEKLVAMEGCELIEWPFLYPVTEVNLDYFSWSRCVPDIVGNHNFPRTICQCIVCCRITHHCDGDN